MSDLHPPPQTHEEFALVCTDDTILFHTDRSLGIKRLQQLDDSFDVLGIPRQANKDVNVETSITGLGCELSNSPPKVEPAWARLGHLLAGVFELAETRKASPLGVAAALGVAQRFALMSRSFLSIFDDVYGFARLDDGETVRDVPDGVVQELLVFAALSPLLVADLSRDFHPLLMACDAAPEYGFGVSACPITALEATELGTFAERRGDYVRLARDGGGDE